ncbi:hypothetical protein [Flavobacterium capsici]|uniref:Uncharacterized protein n=1 Tax=Flavobacterium capsici TaxID=3075618 RepID=A0AA96F289_9FLAO|nr:MULTISPECIES: hypothetical protein [unclassified Flavobacterium]WNM18632.1 hypothetical protein RN608_11500 [Flavobacterium sp. PMR2A8]WNM22683.1 hypothetical protein RN605_04800 [Flavobacterium sp. PMTSA4]
MTFKFNATKGGNVVPVSLIVFKQMLNDRHSIYIGVFGNQNALDDDKLADSSLEEIYKGFNSYLMKNNIELDTVLHTNTKPDEQHIYDTYKEYEFMLFRK